MTLVSRTVASCKGAVPSLRSSRLLNKPRSLLVMGGAALHIVRENLCRPSRTRSLLSLHPALTRWADFFRSSGAECSLVAFACLMLAAVPAPGQTAPTSVTGVVEDLFG